MNFMTSKFKNVGLIGTHCNPNVAKTIIYIKSFLSNYVSIYIESKTLKKLKHIKFNSYTIEYIANNCDLIIVVGGDGNFLNAGRGISVINNVPIIGINYGKLGFLVDISPDNLKQKLLKILKGNYFKENRIMIKASINRNYKKIKNIIAINDIIINNHRKNNLLKIKIFINDKYAYDQISDGIIISTPTGSTAHSLSAGGPIIYPTLNSIVLIPICSHSLNSKPIIIDANNVIKIFILNNNIEPVMYFDGNNSIKLKYTDNICIKKCSKCLTLLHPSDYDYFYNLRKKLGWNKNIIKL